MSAVYSFVQIANRRKNESHRFYRLVVNVAEPLTQIFSFSLRLCGELFSQGKGRGHMLQAV